MRFSNRRRSIAGDGLVRARQYVAGPSTAATAKAAIVRGSPQPQDSEPWVMPRARAATPAVIMTMPT